MIGGGKRPPIKPIDMGLPSGLKWAPMNMDARRARGFATSPFMYDCSFVSWGNVEPHNPISDIAFEYDWGGVNAQEPWYEGQVYGSTPGSELDTNIDITNDVARQICGNNWRMPSQAEFIELFTNCDFVQADGITVIDAGTTDKRVNVNGVIGIYLKSKNNGNLLFFACSGNGSDVNWNGRELVGVYWSTTYQSARYCNNLRFNSEGVDTNVAGSRHRGLPVRPVYDESNSLVGLNVRPNSGQTIEPTLVPTSEIESHE